MVPLAGTPSSSIASALASARPAVAVSCPSARQASGGAGSSSERLGPRPMIRPASAPSPAICPEKARPVSRNRSWPSILASIGATPSGPARASRMLNRQASGTATSPGATCPAPATVSVPVSGSDSSRASIPCRSTPPRCSVPRSTRACRLESQAGGRCASVAVPGGQGSVRSAPCSTSSRATIVPPSRGTSATRNCAASARSATPSPPSEASTDTPAAVSTGCGSRRSVTLPPIRTGRPSPSDMIAAMLSR